MNRTVILACSATKRKETTELSALARYDGPAWRTLRKHLTCIVEPPLALSAEHGLISAYAMIGDYDRKLDGPRAAALVPVVAEQLVTFATLGRLRGEIFAYGGKHYRELLDAAALLASDRLGRDLEITYSSGGIGEQLGQLKDYLTRTPPPAAVAEEEPEEGEHEEAGQ